MAAAGPKAPPRMLMYFVLPSSKHIAFDKLFKFNDGSTETLLKTLSQKRNDFVSFLSSPTTAEAGLALAKEYIPHLLGLVHCIENQTDLRTYTPLTYTWTSSVAAEYAKSREWTGPSVYYEAVMSLQTYGYLMVNAATELMNGATSDEDWDNRSKQASSHLRAAAGVFDYVRTVVQPKWPTSPSEDRPQDAVPAVAEAMSFICVAQAQQLAIRRAALNAKMGRGMVARLCIDTYRKFDSALAALQSAPGQLAINLRQICQIGCGIYRAAAMKFLGCEAYDNSKFGVAAGYLIGAVQQLKATAVPTDARWMNALYDAETGEVQHFHRLFEKENSTVYYEKVPAVDQLDIPDARALLTAAPYTPPPTAFAAIV